MTLIMTRWICHKEFYVTIPRWNPSLATSGLMVIQCIQNSLEGLQLSGSLNLEIQILLKSRG